MTKTSAGACKRGGDGKAMAAQGAKLDGGGTRGVKGAVAGGTGIDKRRGVVGHSAWGDLSRGEWSKSTKNFSGNPKTSGYSITFISEEVILQMEI